MQAETVELGRNEYREPEKLLATLSAGACAETFAVWFPSHVPEVFEALTGAFGRFGEVCAALERGLARGTRVLLEHGIGEANYRGLPDFVRFVDDRFRNALGIRFWLDRSRGAPAVEQVLPWFTAAVAACRSREVGFEVDAGSGLPVPPFAGLRRGPARQGTGSPRDAGEVSLVRRGAGEGGTAFVAAVEQLGGIDRFVRPARGFALDLVMWEVCGAARKAAALCAAEALHLVGQIVQARCARLLFAAASPAHPWDRVDLPDLIHACGRETSAGLDAGRAGPDQAPVEALAAAGLRWIRARLDSPGDAGRCLAWSARAAALGLELELETVVEQGMAAGLDDLRAAAAAVPAVRWLVRGPLGLGTRQARPLPGDEMKTLCAWVLSAQGKEGVRPRPRCLPHVYPAQAAEAGLAADRSLGVDFGRGCTGGDSAAFISADGKLSPCACAAIPAVDVRNMRDFRAAWDDGDAFKAARVPSEYRGRCGYCEMRAVCTGCRAAAALVSGDYRNEDPTCTHRPRRQARDRQWTLAKVRPGVRIAGEVEPDGTLVAEVLDRFAAAGTSPHLLVEVAGGDPAIETHVRCLSNACSARGMPMFTAAQGEAEGMPEEAEFDKVVELSGEASPPGWSGERAVNLYVWDAPAAAILAASPDRNGLARVSRVLSGRGLEGAALDVSLKGVPAENPRWPLVCRPAAAGRVMVDAARCRAHGTCVQVCPAGCIKVTQDGEREVAAIDHSRCVRCLSCAEMCPEAAISLEAGSPAVLEPPVVEHKGAGWLTLAAAPADAVVPRTRPPSWQMPRQHGRCLTILGVSMTTQQHHAAALIRDGEILGAVEEERFRRRKQFGWFPPGRPGVTVVADPALTLEEAFPWRAVRWLLERAGITMDDVDCVAVNGIHGRFDRTYSREDPSRPPQIMRSGRIMYIPHHLAHAASAVRVAGMDNGFAFTVDGRGERETAAFFEVEQGRIRRVFDVLVGRDSLVGGVYETVTRILGFGPYGQGSTMGLAALGPGGLDFSRFLSARSHLDYSIHQEGIEEQFGHLCRDRDGPLSDDHIRLAASVQEAAEEVCLRLIEEGLAGRHAANLCLAGGVALNCRLNQRIRQHFGVENIFVQPAAHDAGTAVGAALEAHLAITGEVPHPAARHACLGPDYPDAHIRQVLDDAGVPYSKRPDLAGDVADLLVDGKVVCWFQGRLEFGPRALGARSVLADPRSRTVKDRLNLIKGRQWWRPVCPSILAGREAEYFEHPFFTPFMLFTIPVRPDRYDSIPAVLHLDNTTRPQSVVKEDTPEYYETIAQFERRTGIPMVVNTSFNTAFEPIVNSPEDALASFLHLGADWLAIGEHLVERAALERRGATVAVTPMAAPGRHAEAQASPAPAPERPAAAPHQARPGGRLMLRLTTRCNSRCAHCTIADLAHLQDRHGEQALAELVSARRKGFTEVVFMRGEVTVRKDLAQLVRRARDLGFSHVQIQTNGRMLAYDKYVDTLLAAGATFFEVSLYGPNAQVHDLVAAAAGAFEQTTAGLRNLVRRRAALLVTVPVLKRNYLRLAEIPPVCAGLGVTRLQLNFPRPVKVDNRWNVEPLVRLSEAAPYVQAAMLAASELGLAVDSEGFPLCRLDPRFRRPTEAAEDFVRYRSVDLHRTTDSMADHRRQSRPQPAECRGCALAASCPATWAAYQEVFGTSELVQVEA